MTLSSDPVDTTNRFRVSDRVLWKDVDSQLLAFDPDTLGVHELNESLSSIARLCNGRLACEEIVVAFAEERGLSLEDSARAVYCALRVLMDKRLLEAV